MEHLAPFVYESEPAEGELLKFLASDTCRYVMLAVYFIAFWCGVGEAW